MLSFSVAPHSVPAQWLACPVALCLGAAIFSAAAADEPLVQKIVASDGSSTDAFGLSVSIDGDRAVAGAIWDDTRGSNSGAAYIFEKIDSNWVQVQKLLAPDGAANDVFGRSVAIAGEVILVGANGMDDAGFDSGGAYVFELVDGSWEFVTKLVPGDARANDRAGWNIDLDQSTAIVSAHRKDVRGQDSGAAYIFVRDAAGTWTQQQRLVPADGAANDLFAHDVAIDGDTALVGAYLNDDDGDSSGSAYFFERDANGVWTEQQKITASDANVGFHFGRFVDLEAGTAVIGSPFWHPLNYGSAYVFERQGEFWTESQMLTSNRVTTQENFASSVSISGDAIVLGSLFIEGTNPGKAYEFRRSDSAWQLQQVLLADDGAAGDGLGRAISLSGNQVIVGASGEDQNGFNSGSAYVFDLRGRLGDLNCDGLVTTLDIGPFVVALSSGEFVGQADINSDGRVDLSDIPPFVELLASEMR